LAHAAASNPESTEDGRGAQGCARRTGLSSAEKSVLALLRA